MTDGGQSKYVNETGEGYVGIARVNDDNLCIRLSTESVDWPVGTTVDAYELDEGIALVPEDEDQDEDQDEDRDGNKNENEELSGERCANLTVSPGNGSVNRLNVSYSCIESLDVEHGADIRIYEREPVGLLLVDADDDPRLC